MRTVMLAMAGILLVGGGVGVGGGRATAEPSGNCYECRATGGGNCMDCWYPIAPGHVSCIPYCNGTCSVGRECGLAMRYLELDGDGSLLDDGLGQLALDAAEGGYVGPATVSRSAGVEGQEMVVVRNCRSLVVARSYSEARGRAMELRTSRLSV